MAGRFIPLSGAFNFRDLGGFRGAGGRLVAEGLVYRADALHRLSGRDIALLEGLGIERIYDLRSPVELEKDGIGEFERAGRRYRHLPLVSITLSPFDPTIDWKQINLLDRYLEMLEEGGDKIRTILEELAEPDCGAVVFHCSGGKDRTGVVAAVILRALGVSDDDIVADYAQSENYLRGAIDRYRAELEELGIDREAIEYLTSSSPARMRYTLKEWDRRWGSAEGYLDWIGVTSACRRALRSRLLVE